MIVSDEELMRKTIRAFRDAGYEIWMDDFGSGYSSLTMLKENGIKDEDINWSNYYQKASLNARATDIPLEIVEDDGKTFKTLFMNRAYRDQIGVGMLADHEIDDGLYGIESEMMEKYREFADIAERSGKEETFYYSVGSSKLCLTLCEIAHQGGRHILIGTITNFSKDNKRPVFDADFPKL